MKSIQFAMMTLLLASLASVQIQKADAASSKTQKVKGKEASRLGAQLGTDFTFDELSVRGRYQSAFEGVARVEDEKLLEDLLDYRKDYKDRLANSANQK